jgi:hypothetical protein
MVNVDYDANWTLTNTKIFDVQVHQDSQNVVMPHATGLRYAASRELIGLPRLSVLSQGTLRGRPMPTRLRIDTPFLAQVVMAVHDCQHMKASIAHLELNRPDTSKQSITGVGPFPGVQTITILYDHPPLVQTADRAREQQKRAAFVRSLRPFFPNARITVREEKASVLLPSFGVVCEQAKDAMEVDRAPPPPPQPPIAYAESWPDRVRKLYVDALGSDTMKCNEALLREYMARVDRIMLYESVIRKAGAWQYVEWLLKNVTAAAAPQTRRPIVACSAVEYPPGLPWIGPAAKFIQNLRICLMPALTNNVSEPHWPYSSLRRLKVHLAHPRSPTGVLAEFCKRLEHDYQCAARYFEKETYVGYDLGLIEGSVSAEGVVVTWDAAATPQQLCGVLAALQTYMITRASEAGSK